VENQTGRKAKYFRSDNGLEYRDAEILEFCKKKCITHHFTVKGTPQQNKVAEMMNRTLLEEVECSFAKKKKIELRQLIMHASSQTDLYLLRLISRFLRKYRQVNKFIIHFENTWLP
jgi:transposase InsO family protein